MCVHIRACACLCSLCVCVFWTGVKEVRLERTNTCPNNCNINLLPVTMTHFKELLRGLFAAPPLLRISVLKL